MHVESYWELLWKQFNKNWIGRASLYLLYIFIIVGVYAPFLASSKPFVVQYEGAFYFPFFRYLFYPGFYTKRIDLFFNLLQFTLPLGLLSGYFLQRWRLSLGIAAALQLFLFLYLIFFPVRDPAANTRLIESYRTEFKLHPELDWQFDLLYMNDYARLNLLLRQQQLRLQHERLVAYSTEYAAYATGRSLSSKLPTLWQNEIQREADELIRLKKTLEVSPKDSDAFKQAQSYLKYISERRRWIDENMTKLHYEVMPFFRDFHWEEDAGGDESLNQYIPWWELSRINHKDLMAALIFGIRISLVVGLISVAISLAIGIPVGALAGFYGGTFDIIVCRLLEIWESMPTFFMLLLVVAITQSKSIFLVIAIIGFFGWTGFSRYIRGEYFKQRNLAYVDACKAQGFGDGYVIFTHILPNSIPPLLTLLPFAIMGAITSESGLSFLGLGEEGSCSWGVLMDEGRSAFPAQSQLLWPPAILLTTMLVAIALVGDAFRDALDPKLHR